MSTISEMMGVDKKIEQAVTDALVARGLTPEEISCIVKLAVDSYAADLYATMRELEMYKYKFIELDTKLSNLVDFCRKTNTEEGG